MLAEPKTHLLDGKRWHDPVIEDPVLDTTEIWSLVNLTDDTHPIHLHLARFQILDRRPFDVSEYLVNKHIRYTGAFPPDSNEAGWKTPCAQRQAQLLESSSNSKRTRDGMSGIAIFWNTRTTKRCAPMM